MGILHEAISEKLELAVTICLIVDIWTNMYNIDFIGLGASVSNSNGLRELIVIDFQPMSGKHTAENIGTAIENMLNKFVFNKAKIHGL